LLINPNIADPHIPIAITAIHGMFVEPMVLILAALIRSSIASQLTSDLMGFAVMY
jgi:hypothetical protein